MGNTGVPKNSKQAQSSEGAGKHGATTSDAAAALDPISALEEDHELQLEFCDALEHIADGLPDEADPALAGLAITILRDDLPMHIRFEEEALFPVLRRRVPTICRICHFLEILESEHETDESYALEVAEELALLVRKGRPENPEMLGYMLRGFFVSQRRHIAWENEIILPLARDVLRDPDRDELRQWLATHAAKRRGRYALRRLREIGAPL